MAYKFNKEAAARKRAEQVNEGIKIIEEEVPRFFQETGAFGYYSVTRDCIVVRSDLSEKQKLKTLQNIWRESLRF